MIENPVIGFNFEVPIKEILGHEELFLQPYPNEHGHFSILVRDISVDNTVLEQHQIPAPLTLDYLSLIPEQELPTDVNPYRKAQIFTIYNDLETLANHDHMRFSWNILGDSLGSPKRIAKNKLVRKSHEAFQTVIEKSSTRKVLVIRSHGGEKELTLGEAPGARIKALDVLDALEKNLKKIIPQFQHLNTEYAALLLANCNEGQFRFPLSIAQKLEIPIFYNLSSAGLGDTRTPVFTLP